MTERPSMPTVTLTGAAAPAERADVLDAGPDVPADPRRLRRRRTVTALAWLGLLVAVGAGAEVFERREAADAARAQEQRDSSAVELALSNDWSGSSSYDPATDSILYEVQLTVSNNGPRDVVVLRVGLPGVRLGAPLPLSYGADSDLTLNGVYSCTDSFPQGPPDSVPFDVRTEAGPRSVDVPIPAGMFDSDPLVEACEEIRASRAAAADEDGDQAATA